MVAWALLITAQDFAVSRSALEATRNDVTFCVLVLFSYPHFAASQWLCYSRGRAFLKKNWFELFAVPVALLAPLAWLYFHYDSVGPLGLRFFLTAFVFLSGWHFAMQAFGSSVISFYYEGHPLGPSQRRALKTSLVALWLYFFLGRVTNPEDRVFFGVETFHFSMPPWLGAALAGVVGVAAARVVYLLIVKPWRRDGTLAGGRAIVPWLSLFFWWLPAARSPEFFLYGIPLFHGLQQYAFTYRFERGRGASQAKILLLAAGLVAFGYLLHRTVPLAMDSTRFSRCPNYFFLCFTFIINIHHYFLDRANWRLSDPETRRVLLGVAPDRVAEPEFSSGATSPI